MTKCRWHTDKKTGQRYHVPGCWGGLHNSDGCYCYPEKNEDSEKHDDEIDSLKKRVAALEAGLLKP